MLAKQFYDIIHHKKSATNFVIEKNLLVNVNNILCNKCGSQKEYYLKKNHEKTGNFEV